MDGLIFEESATWCVILKSYFSYDADAIKRSEAAKKKALANAKKNYQRQQEIDFYELRVENLKLRLEPATMRPKSCFEQYGYK